jgi:predicted Zn finger-like uncharacterized protein
LEGGIRHGAFLGGVVLGLSDRLAEKQRRTRKKAGSLFRLFRHFQELAAVLEQVVADGARPQDAHQEATRAAAVAGRQADADLLPQQAAHAERSIAAMKTTCPACGAILHLDDSFEGKRVRCDDCDEVFVADPRQP